MRLNKRLKDLRASHLATTIVICASLSIVTHSVQANPFATPNLTSNPYTCPANPNNAKDSANHKMYAVAVNYRPYAPQSSQKLIWAAGTEKKIVTFEGNKDFTITFSNLIDEVNASTNPFFGEGRGPGPSYGTYNSGNENTVDAINTRHGNTVGQNHILDLQVNRNVSKIGYKIQDVDSEGNDFVRYQQRVDVSPNGGVFNLSFNTALQNINSDNNIITAVALQECSLGQCVIDASWRYTIANNKVRLRHSNIEKNATAYNRNHIVGYSDFYFCLAPPKVIIKKILNSARIKDIGNDRDQFEISVNRDTTPLQPFTTTGSGTTVTNDSSSVISLAENTIYTVTERVMNGATLGNIANYDATYSCTNATTGAAMNLSSGAMAYDATTKTRSFGLSDLKYGDEITCTITNSAANDTFSGIVFNDNGNIESSKANRQNISALFTDNKKYFNGRLDADELGVYENGLQVSLTDCEGNTLDNKSVDVLSSGKDIGKYSITVSRNKLVDSTGNTLTKVCLVEKEPSGWKYSVDTTTDTREVTLVPEVYNYENLNFGEVESNNTALVLIKSQHIHDCDESFTYPTNVGNAADLEIGFGIQAVENVIPGRCIAYRVTAYNRGHVELESIRIKDTLQRASVTSTFHLPFPVGNPTSINPYNNSLPNDIITSRPFNLLGVQSSTDVPQATLYFNTKYGSTLSN